MNDTIDAGFGKRDVRSMGREVGRVSRGPLEPAAGDLVVVKYGETKKGRKERDGEAP